MVRGGRRGRGNGEGARRKRTREGERFRGRITVVSTHRTGSSCS